MTESVAVVRKWGNSLGVTLSKELVEKQKIKPRDQIVISIQKVKPLMSLFGTLKTRESTQAIKNKLKEGWD